jgi:transposase-like protein
MRKEGQAELWIARINDYRASGERVVTWCERHQVTARQLWYWMRKLRKAEQQTPSASKPQWVSLCVDETAAGGASPLLVKVGGATIELRPGFEPALFAAVVRTLQTLC